jgi:hypothetical protein
MQKFFNAKAQRRKGTKAGSKIANNSDTHWIVCLFVELFSPEKWCQFFAALPLCAFALNFDCPAQLNETCQPHTHQFN